jgi:hypothetical protein
MSFWVGLALVAVLSVIVLFVKNLIAKYTGAGLVWALLCFAGFGLAGFSGANSTKPSSAPRVTVTGIVADCIEHQRGKGNFTYSFVLVPITGVPVELESRIKAPLCWQGTGAASKGRVYRVVYLDDPNRNLKNEVVQIEVVQGENAGWHGAIDARPFGLWLGIPAGIVFIIIGGIGMVRNRKVQQRASVQVRETRGPVKDSDSELTSLKL